MPFRRSRSTAPEVSDPVVAARLARVEGPESGIFRLVPEPVVDPSVAPPP